MLRQRRLRKITKAFKTNQSAISYAYCPSCEENFIDDILPRTNVGCPNGCPWMLERGHKKPFKPITRKVRAKSKSKVTRKAAKKAAKKHFPKLMKPSTVDSFEYKEIL